MTWVETRSGRLVDLRDPDPMTISVYDIAGALAAIPRNNGHTTDRPYSVAQHDVWRTRVAREHFRCDATTGLYVLLGSAHEAYMGHLVAVFAALPEIRNTVSTIASRLTVAVHRSMNLAPLDLATRSLLDTTRDMARTYECKHLFHSRGSALFLPYPAASVIMEKPPRIQCADHARQDYLAWFHDLLAEAQDTSAGLMAEAV